MYKKLLVVALVIMMSLFPVLLVTLMLSRTPSVLFSVFIWFVYLSLYFSAFLSILYILRAWRRIKVFAAIPLLLTLLALTIVTIIAPRISESFHDYLFVRNYVQYTGAVEYIKNNLPPGEKELCELPEKYRYLSKNGKVMVIKNADGFNVVFYYVIKQKVIRWVIYSSSGELSVPTGEKKFLLTGIRPNWYYMNTNTKPSCIMPFPFNLFTH